MSDVVTEAPPPAKSSKLPLLIGLVLALLMGGGSFFSIYSGMILAPHPTGAPGTTPEVELPPLPAVSFVPVPQIIISLGSGTAIRHLRFSAQLEVTEGQQGDVGKLMPRVLDILNGYLRAVSLSDLEDPSALLRLRAQMLRRVQVVTGDGRVRDLLIAEFVLN